MENVSCFVDFAISMENRDTLWKVGSKEEEN